jgi:ArsR family metal-binding transcriptional regulator
MKKTFPITAKTGPPTETVKCYGFDRIRQALKSSNDVSSSASSTSRIVRVDVENITAANNCLGCGGNPWKGSTCNYCGGSYKNKFI